MKAFAAGAFLAAVGVLLGAFGAHGLRDIGVTRLGYWTTATHYLFVAALGVMLTGLFDRGARVPDLGPATVLLVGVSLFCGSLYAMGLGGARWLGAITPVGGIALVAGFLWLGVRSLR